MGQGKTVLLCGVWWLLHKRWNCAVIFFFWFWFPLLVFTRQPSLVVQLKAIIIEFVWFADCIWRVFNCHCPLKTDEMDFSHLFPWSKAAYCCLFQTIIEVIVGMWMHSSCCQKLLAFPKMFDKFIVSLTKLMYILWWQLLHYVHMARTIFKSPRIFAVILKSPWIWSSPW